MSIIGSLALNEGLSSFQGPIKLEKNSKQISAELFELLESPWYLDKYKYIVLTKDACRDFYTDIDYLIYLYENSQDSNILVHGKYINKEELFVCISELFDIFSFVYDSVYSRSKLVNKGYSFDADDYENGDNLMKNKLLYKISNLKH